MVKALVKDAQYKIRGPRRSDDLSWKARLHPEKPVRDPGIDFRLRGRVDDSRRTPLHDCTIALCSR
jgi:hypothetical protein